MGLPVMATTPEFFTAFHPSPGEAWKFRDGHAIEKTFDVVLGASAARASGLKVGDQLFLVHGMSTSRDAPRPTGKKTEHDEHDEHDDHNGHADHQAHEEGKEAGPHVHDDFVYTVVGILEPTGGSHDRALITQVEAAWVLHASDRRERAAGGKHVPTSIADLTEGDKLITGIYIRLATPADSAAPSNFAQVGDMLRRDTSITVASPSQQIDQLFRIVGNIDSIFLAMAIVVMVSSGISIMLALYNSMDQRRRQIAIVRVLGASAGRVFGLIITEAALIGMLGAGAGVLLSIAGAAVTAGILKKTLGLVVDSGLEPRQVMIVVAGTVALGAAAGVIPAFLAYRTSVARNLKPVG
jgi:putative ABC transport system permease protein